MLNLILQIAHFKLFFLKHVLQHLPFLQELSLVVKLDIRYLLLRCLTLLHQQVDRSQYALLQRPKVLAVGRRVDVHGLDC